MRALARVSTVGLCLLGVGLGACSGGGEEKHARPPSSPPLRPPARAAVPAAPAVAAVVLDSSGRRRAALAADGPIERVTGDGHGGWYLSGAFRHVAGAARTRRAHVDAYGHLERSGAPRVGGDAVVAFGRVFVGIGERVLARDLNSGRRERGFRVRTGPDNTEGPGVRALAVAGRWLYLGGRFTKVQGVARVGLARVDARSGRLDRGWRPPTLDTSPCGGCDGDVMAIAATATRVYALGSFSGAGGVRTPGGLVALDAASARVTRFRAPRAGHDAAGDVGFYQSAAVVGPRLFVGGDFGNAGRVRARGFAMLDAETGAVLPSWHPSSKRASVVSVTRSGSSVLVAGEGLGG